jgi:hypothetical protein|tara:strand:- start:606 stop:920 length:315 start_codon:yes stop_codon:yes gene_type:complete
MNNSCNNIKLEIEMPNRERGDSVISDIETALDVPTVKNKTLNDEEIKQINKCGGIIDRCNEKCEKHQVLINTLTTGCFIICLVGVVYITVYGFMEFIKYIFNYI